ncbi:MULTISPECIES: PEGA domain-containing protein [unclassified Methanoregula]|uniref:PEGA domain-containing protein n=1 Tax=unclassified Methanoregula TaxID=2649730 RepID=UPI0025EC8D4E|nr:MULTISPECIES: PEGA domain-containing protein [unclassified Methanoregula]
MNQGTILLVAILCIAAIPAGTLAENYMGGEIVLGGGAPGGTIRITEIPTTAVRTTAAPAAAATGSVSIQTSPAGATVYIDGVRQGISPAVIPGLSPGAHTILLKKDGYSDLSVTAPVTGGQTKELVLVMTKLAAAGTATPPTPAPPTRKTPGFEMISGITALGAAIVARKKFR